MAELIGAAVLFAGFLAVERRQVRPMIDLRFLRRPTYVGANLAGFAYAMTFLTMLTYLPLYFQNGMGRTPLAAGLLILPMASPLFLIPRVVSQWLAPRWSGRTLLSTGLVLIGIGLLWTGPEMHGFHYGSILVPMLIATCGAGILNGETTRVGMTVIPAERAGMASGVSGTVKFSGLVIGFAALGAILYAQVGASLATALPGQSAAVREHLARAIAGSNLDAARAMVERLGGSSFAQSSFGSGYHALMITAGTFALVASALSWLLIDPSETAPIQGKADHLGNVDALIH